MIFSRILFAFLIIDLWFIEIGTIHGLDLLENTSSISKGYHTSLPPSRHFICQQGNFF